MDYNLFLDDEREPHKVTWKALRVGGNPQRLPTVDWEVVRNYVEFLTCVGENGIPTVVAFDHDLADEHYSLPTSDGDDYSDHKEKTGYHCARWLCEHCIKMNRQLPKEIYIHSMNLMGRENILSVFHTAKKHFDWL
jgi:hypothetical protein